MPTCVTCGEEDFDLIDGHYYCTVCQTQTQEIQEEEQEDEFVPNTFNITLEVKKKKKIEEKKETYKGRPWRLHEGFGVLLKKQTEALISLGANPQLEDVVFRIWVVYMAKLRLAFTDQSATSLDSNAVDVINQRARDKFLGTVENPQPKSNVRFNASYRKAFGFLPRGKQRRKLAKEQEEFAASLDHQEFYEGDNPQQEERDENDMEKDLLRLAEAELEEEVEQAERHTDKTILSKSRIKESCYWLSKEWVLGVAYLALQYTNNLVMPHDIIRLVDQGQVPYNQAESVFPEDMKFAQNDHSIFCSGKSCSADILRKKTSLLAKFLSLNEFPSPPVETITSRYVLELDLPNELHGLIHEMLKAAPLVELLEKCTVFGSELPHYSAVAMAYLIVTLKLLFGLDDSTERELSAYAREVQEAVQPEPPLFIWEDWVASREDAHSAGEASACSPDGDERSVANSQGAGVRLTSRFVKTQKNRLIRADTRRAIARPLIALLSNCEISATQTSSVAQTHGAREQSNQPESQAGHSESADQCLGQRKNFSQCSVQYIIEEEDFIRTELAKRNTGFVAELAPVCDFQENDEDLLAEHSQSCDFDYFGLSKRFCSHAKTKDQGQHRPSRPSCNSLHQKEMLSRLLAKYFPTFEDATISTEDRTTSPSPPSSCPLGAHKKYMTYSQQDSRGPSKHRSYLWLLDMCAGHICTTGNLVEYIVQKLEFALFRPNNAWKKRRKLKVQRQQMQKILAFRHHNDAGDI